MNRKSLLTSACILCATITTLFVHGSYAADYGEMGIQTQSPNKCVSEPALPGYKWYGKAPLCNGKKAKKDCEDADGDVIKTNACGDGNKCQSGYKVLCRMANASQYQQAPDTTTSTGTWSAVTVTGEDSGTDTGSTSTTYKNTDTPKIAPTSSVHYLGNPPFCNADNKLSYCEKDLKGKEVGRSKCNEPGKYQKCCKTGKYLQCLAPDITGG